MPIFDYRGSRPRLGNGVFLAPTAVVTGEVEIGDDVSFWFHSVAPGQTVPSGHLVLGIPAKVVRPLTQKEQSEIRDISHRYLEVKNSYLEQMGPGY